jgi:hypothetical protein
MIIVIIIIIIIMVNLFLLVASVPTAAMDTTALKDCPNDTDPL